MRAVVMAGLGLEEKVWTPRQQGLLLSAATPETPVIMLTGWGQRMAADGDAPPHVDCVLSKPPRLRELNAALAQWGP